MALPAPRQIRLAKSGTWFRWVVALALGPIFAVIAVNLYQDWARTSSFASMGRRDLIMAGVAGGLVMLAAGIWRSQKRECDLLEHGEVVVGCVMRQWSDQKQVSSVEYEFTDFLGQTHRAVGFDRTMRLYSGMPVPVFYDRDNPKRQVAYCAALHQVVLTRVSRIEKRTIDRTAVNPARNTLRSLHRTVCVDAYCDFLLEMEFATGVTCRLEW
ncbi:MAG: hypothetical protein ACRD40_07040 [Candidatus Acidiferrales bacterium]